MASHDENVWMETNAVLSAVKVAVVQFSEIFHEVAGGDSSDPQHAENLAAQCGDLLRLCLLKSLFSVDVAAAP